MAKVSRALVAGSARAAASKSAAGFRTVGGWPELDIRLSSLTAAIVEGARSSGLEILDADYRHARILGFCGTTACRRCLEFPR